MFTIFMKALAACVGAYFLFSIGRLIFVLLFPEKKEPINLDPISTEYGLLTINPSEDAEDWILQQSEGPFPVHVLGIPPDAALLRFLNPIMEHVHLLDQEIEEAGSTAQTAKLYLLYERKGTCYFDMVLPSQTLQMGYSNSKGVYRL